MTTRNTIQFALVFDAVNLLQNHATADQIYEEIIKTHPHVSKCTVYRNLNRLSEMGKIHKLSIPGSPDRFDHMCHKHYHIKCKMCGCIFDVDMEYIADLQKQIRDTHGFEITGHDIVFQGLCPSCRK